MTTPQTPDFGAAERLAVTEAWMRGKVLSYQAGGDPVMLSGDKLADDIATFRAEVDSRTLAHQAQAHDDALTIQELRADLASRGKTRRGCGKGCTASLRAAGWENEGEAGGGDWNRGGESTHTNRRTDQPMSVKTRWRKRLNAPRFPVPEEGGR